MADKKISQLTAASTPLAGNEVLPIVQSGSTVKVFVADLTAGRAIAATNGTFTGNVELTNGADRFVQIGSSSNYNYKLKSVADDFQILDGAGSIRLTIAYPTGNITVGQGNVVIGTAGKGIDFSANTHAAGMTSELLNDYEEGTWTPTDASGAGLSLTVSSATYTKIGRQVTAQFDITFPATADTATQLLGGLPFLPSGINFGGFVSYTTHGAALNLLVFASGGNGVVSFRQAAGGSNNNNAAYSGNVIRGVLVYFV